MRHFIFIGTMAVFLAGCTSLGKGPLEGQPVTTEEAPASDQALTSAPPPPAAATTAAALDTTSAAQRVAAAAPAKGAKQSLGKTIVSLGNPTEPGFWMKTPLVKVQTKGRVRNPANGQSSAVTLIPIDGPETAGSRMSLPAMRLIGLSLTELTEVEVTQEG